MKRNFFLNRIVWKSGAGILIVVATFLFVGPSVASATVIFSEIGDYSVATYDDLPFSPVRWHLISDITSAAGVNDQPFGITFNTISNNLSYSGSISLCDAIFNNGSGGCPVANIFEIYYFDVLNGHVASSSSVVFGDTSTRFIDVIPAYASTTGTTSVQIGANIYLNDFDLASSTQLRISYGIANLGLGGITALDAWNNATNFGHKDIVFPISSSGYLSFSTTTDFTDDMDYGWYNYRAQIEYSDVGPWYCFDGFFCGSNEILIATTSVWLVSTTSVADTWSALQVAAVNDILATSTAALNCHIANFNLGSCLYSLFLPSQGQLEDAFKVFYDGVLTRFPLGYITSGVVVLKDTTKTPIPVLNATVPEGIPGAGSNINLDLSELGWIFEATSTFGTSEQKGQSLFSIVNPYWEIFVYLGFFVYIFGRILGWSVIPHDAVTRETGAVTVVSKGVDSRGNKITKTHSIRKSRGLKL